MGKNEVTSNPQLGFKVLSIIKRKWKKKKEWEKSKVQFCNNNYKKSSSSRSRSRSRSRSKSKSRESHWYEEQERDFQERRKEELELGKKTWTWKNGPITAFAPGPIFTQPFPHLSLSLSQLRSRVDLPTPQRSLTTERRRRQQTGTDWNRQRNRQRSRQRSRQDSFKLEVFLDHGPGAPVGQWRHHDLVVLLDSWRD